MGLKLDELRKRLLQQQSRSDGGTPEPSANAGNDRLFGAASPKASEAAIAPKDSEPPPTTKASEPSAVTKAPEPPVERKLPAPQPPVVSAASEPSEADESEAAERVSSIRSDPEPEASRFSFGKRVAAAAAAGSEPVAQHELADAVGKVFEQTKAFQARLEDLSRIFEPIDRMGNSAVRAFAPMREFQKQMAQLGRSFEPIRTFQQQLSQLAQTFEPMKALEGQISQLADSFQGHIGDLIKALEPANQMRERIEQLGAALDQASELQEQFIELYHAFQLNPSSNAHTNGLDTQGGAAR
jgi:hypothetical protein